MEAVVFWFAALAALAGAIGVVFQRNPFYSVLFLVMHLIALATLFLLLSAEFVAAAQVIVYAGAVMVLYVFVVAYVGGLDDDLTEPSPIAAAITPLLVGALFVELSLAITGSGLKTIDSHGAKLSPGFGSPEQIGELFLTRFLIAFEVVSLLLLVAAVGAVVLAKREPRAADHPSRSSEGVGLGRMDIVWYLILSALIFCIGAAGVLTRRSPLVILICLELMLNAGNLALVAFSRMTGTADGQVFALIVMIVAAAEVVIGLGLIVAMYRRRLPMDVDEMNELKG